VGVIHLVTILYQNFRLGRVMYHALEIVAQRIGLSPVYQNGKDRGQSGSPAVVQSENPEVN
ncbi:MAG: hypothetical protein ACRERD_14770, partial [Candidatus Binatia bacterium]